VFEVSEIREEEEEISASSLPRVGLMVEVEGSSFLDCIGDLFGDNDIQTGSHGVAENVLSLR
jgi:hypothetical protein